MTKRQVITWDGFAAACSELVLQLQPLPIEDIVTTGRGGLVPTAIIAHHLGLDSTRVKVITGLGAQHYCERHNILVIDEVCDTGRTFRMLRSYLPNAIYAAPYVKTVGSHYCHHKVVEVAQDVWLDFPWERY
jgi:xanthine phosphoribosyltransferase